MLKPSCCAGLRVKQPVPFTATKRQNACIATPLTCSSRSNTIASSSRRLHAAACFALATEDDVDQAASTELSLSPPSLRLQHSLDNKQTREVKSRANGLAATRKLVRVNMGKKGITDNFVIDCMRALRGHEVIRVSVTEGADMDMDEAADVLTGLLDCVCVHKIGSSLTLYRSRDLAMPSNITDMAAQRAGQKLPKQRGPGQQQRRPQQQRRQR